MRPLLPLLLLLVLLTLSGCVEKEGLTERNPTGALAQGPDCRACHAYPPSDTNHAFHLFYPTVLKTINGPITCLDCHSTALAKRSVFLLDTIFRDSLGNEWSSVDMPVDPLLPSLADTIRLWPRVRVDTLPQDRPVPAPDRPGSLPLLTEYVTALAHMNGRVDVAFHPRVTDTGKFPGMRAGYNPAKETCSAVACHPVIADGTPHWRFADSAKGLRELIGLPGDVP